MIALEATSTLAAILTAVGSVITSAISWVTSFVSTITATGNELILLFVIIPVVGLGVGLLSRLKNL